MKLCLISNVTMDLLAGMLRKEHEVVLPDGFNNWIQQCLNPAASLYTAAPDAYFVLLDGGALFPADADDRTCDDTLAFAAQALRALAANPQGAPVFIGNVDIPHLPLTAAAVPWRERRLEARFEELVAELASTAAKAYPFELKNIVETMGRAAFYDAKMRQLGGMPFSLAALKTLTVEIKRTIGAYLGKRRKVLAVDLDNTLWKGVVGEDGPQELKPFVEFQTRLRELKDLGILLVVLSKNNPEDAHAAFRLAPRMVLKEDDFVAMQVNWDSKPDNLAELATRLNLGRDAFVFIDDNPAERAAMQAALPEVAVPEFPKDTAKLPEMLAQVYRDWFYTLETTEEDRRKTAAYQVENARRELAAQSVSVESYLKSLDIRATFRQARPQDLPRVAQLTQKTNQFNVTTRRYSEADIARFAEADDVLVLTAHASDRFGDNGLIAVLILRINGTVADVDTFLMSCRVMGRTIEHAFLNYAEQLAVARGCTSITAAYLPTAKNAPVKELWPSLGYVLTAHTDEADHYCLDLGGRINHVTYATGTAE